MTKKPQELVVLDRCKKQIMEIRDLPSLLEIRDKSKAIASYLQTRDDGFETANYAKSIVALSEARCGLVIKEMQKDGTLDAGKGGDRKSEKSPSQDVRVMSDLGITYNESSRMQLASEVLDAEPDWFAVNAEEGIAASKDFTQQAVIRKGKEIRNEALGETKVKTPRGKYNVIVLDPPWPMEKIERDVAPNQAAFDYPTMTEDELAEMTLPSADDCHVWCWTTHKFLPMALRLLPQWGAKYICTFVWHKPGGFQPFGLPQYNCEFSLYARIGTPKFTDTKKFNVCFDAPRGAHSEKPAEFYDVVRRVTEGKRLDMFSRRKFVGFKGWGNEA